jgi:transcriptional regulator with XRE-family HTH domain
MAISGLLQDFGEPRAPRRRLQLTISGELASGEATSVVVRNISATGLLLESPVALAAGETITIELPEAGVIQARIVWNSGDLFGCQFAMPISAAALSAAMLRGTPAAETDSEADFSPRRDAHPNPAFGIRLQRLRKERGLSQAQVAASLGVSKPTVWAWEHGKARPVGSRMAGLAETLGVDEIELTPDAAGSVLDEIVAKSREQIAAAIGTTPEKVRISIEF